MILAKAEGKMQMNNIVVKSGLLERKRLVGEWFKFYTSARAGNGRKTNKGERFCPIFRNDYFSSMATTLKLLYAKRKDLAERPCCSLNDVSGA